MDNRFSTAVWDEDIFIDESGLTSLEPEGVGHPHAIMTEYDRFEGRMAEDAVLERGTHPVEGDGTTDGGLSD